MYVHAYSQQPTNRLQRTSLMIPAYFPHHFSLITLSTGRNHPNSISVAWNFWKCAWKYSCETADEQDHCKGKQAAGQDDGSGVPKDDGGVKRLSLARLLFPSPVSRLESGLGFDLLMLCMSTTHEQASKNKLLATVNQEDGVELKRATQIAEVDNPAATARTCNFDHMRFIQFLPASQLSPLLVCIRMHSQIGTLICCPHCCLPNLHSLRTREAGWSAPC